MTASLERANYKVTFSVLVVGVSAYALLQSLVIPALPTIQAVMHTNQNTVTWVITAYLLSASIFTPIMGRLGDMIGKEHVLIATLIALSIGSIIAALAHSIIVLIIGRAVQGVGGGVMPLSFGIIRDEFPKEKLAAAIGTIAAMTAVGGGAGLVIGGPIINSLGFHWLFWIPLIMTAAAAVFTYLCIPESPVRTSGRISWSASLSLSAWLVALLLGVSEAPVWGWGSSKVIGLLFASVLLIALWMKIELTVKTPLIDMKMMRIPAVWTNNLVSFLFGVGMYSVMAFLPEFLQTARSNGYGFGASTVASGLFLLPMTFGMFVLGLYSGKIAAKYGSKLAVIVGSAISCGGYVVLAFAHDESWEIYLASAFLGIGLGLAYSAMSNLIVLAVPPAQTGVASGMNANIRTIGGAVGAGVMSSIVTSTLLRSGVPAESGYAHGFLFLAVITLIAVVAAALIPASTPDDVVHMAHAELAIVPGGTITEG
jgi:EmrB/QacA subfamily drug resistance transporter